MASSYGQQMAYPQASYHPAAQPSVGHPGMFAPGTKVQVGQHRVIVEKYLSEGGFAHVYVVRIPREGNKYDPAVLKRVAVPDKDNLANMRTEVETMKKLKGHKHIVSYIDSHASQLKGGGYEVFLLMEFCQGGGLIDFMNTRLQHRLTEPEILKIFSDVAEGVACMHYLKPPLLHRDLKVENVLISSSGSSRTYKLCDFGSTAPPRPAANSAQEARLIEDDVQRHTTMQYRSPEMVDVYRKQAINEKSDIWALGVLLYKLCYYTTPFEEQGQMAILNASFKYPHHPSFSDRLKKLIGTMLKEHPNSRPNIYQVITEVCSMRNTNVPIKDIYSARSQSEARGFEASPTKEKVTSPGPVIGLAKVESKQDDRAAIPDIAPMRRGRPTAGSQLNVPSATTSASSRPTSADPFAALDAKLSSRKQPPPDELSERFPSLQEFSILHGKGTKFEFDQSASDSATTSKAQNLDTRVTYALADEAFSQLRHAKSADIRPNRSDASVARSTSLKKPSVPTKDTARAPGTARVPASSSTSTASPNRSGMVSTGVQTSPATSPQIGSLRNNIRDRPIWRVPQSKSPALNSRDEETLIQRPQLMEKKLPHRPEPLSRPGLLSRNRTKSQTMTLELPTSPVSSRPSLEGSRPSLMEIAEPNGTRSRSANAQLRQVSANVDAAMEDLPSRRDPYRSDSHKSRNAINNESSGDEAPEQVESATDFLRSREVESSARPRIRHRSSSASKKRLSLPAISLSGTRNILSGKFGDAFKRFETNTTEETPINDRPGDEDILNHRALSPVAGSVGNHSQGEEEAIDETEDLSPEFRRELERRRLSQEEKRVAAAAAEYRQRLQQGGSASAGPRQVSSIQSRIQNYVDQSRSAAPPPRTAEGYGKFTDESPLAPTPADRPFIAKKAHNMPTKTLTAPAALPLPVAPRLASTLPLRTGSPRPNVAPKPQALRTGGPTVGLARPPNGNSPLLQMSATEEEDDSVLAFTKKFPGLDNFDLVDMEFEDPMPRSRNGVSMKSTNGTNGTMRVRDV